MPLYMCNAKKGLIDPAAKEKIADAITRIHCDVTDAPPDFVHAFFFEDAPHAPLNGSSALVFGSIRAGRTDTQKAQIAAEMKQAVHDHARIPLNEIATMIRDVPARWVMEGGDIMPEPGEEAEWLAAHAAKAQAG